MCDFKKLKCTRSASRLSEIRSAAGIHQEPLGYLQRSTMLDSTRREGEDDGRERNERRRGR